MAQRACRLCGGAVLVQKAGKQLLTICTLCKHREVKVFTSKGG